MLVRVQKSLGIAASSRGVASVSSVGVYTASTVAYTSGYGGNDLGTQRRLILSASAATDQSAIYTLVGTREGGGVVIETIQGSSVGGVVTTTQDFLTLTSASVSSGTAAPYYVGTTTVGGSPWQMVDVSRDVVNIGFMLTMSTSRASMTNTLDVTAGDPMTLGGGSSGATYPWPFTSTAVTSITAYSTWSSPITAWRLSLTSTSTSAYVATTAVQAGIP